MTHKEALDVLISMLNKHSLTTKQKEAITVAVGALSWFSLAGSRIKAIKNKKEKTLKNNYIFPS